MEKDKILRQLEEKLLPSVQNLEKEQATEHDFFPALYGTPQCQDQNLRNLR